MRECQQCALCCKLLDIEGLAAQGAWCKYCQPGKIYGCCKIHDARPEICVGYECVWRLDDTMPETLKPNRCGVVFEEYQPENFIIGMVDRHKADAWQRGELRKKIAKFLGKGYFVWIRIGKDRHLLLPKHISEIEAHRLSKIAWERTVRKKA